jgi:hypothetical protein
MIINSASVKKYVFLNIKYFQIDPVLQNVTKPLLPARFAQQTSLSAVWRKQILNFFDNIFTNPVKILVADRQTTNFGCEDFRKVKG